MSFFAEKGCKALWWSWWRWLLEGPGFFPRPQGWTGGSLSTIAGICGSLPETVWNFASLSLVVGCWRYFPAMLSTVCGRELSYKLVVVGGGAGGCGTANKFANKLGKDQVRQSRRNGKFFWKRLKPQWISGCCDRARRDALLPTNVDVGEKPSCNSLILLLQFLQVGGGLKSLAQSGRPMENCLPK